MTISTLVPRTAVRHKASQSVTQGWIRALDLTSRIDKDPLRTLPVVIDELALRFGNAPALLSEREWFSFQTLADRARRYTRWAIDQQLAAGETVCLLMPNRPEYLAIWLGLTRIGVVVALLNTNLAGRSLAHSIAIVGPKRVIVAADLLAAYLTAVRELANAPPHLVHGAVGTEPIDFADRIDLDIASRDGRPFAAGELGTTVTVADRALCIYTSGTTGLPKAANVSHHRVMSWSYWFAGMMATGPDDRLYDCLPLYHSVGGVVAIGSVLVNGGSVVIRERFSAGRFWDDIVRFECTLFQYIGELCRYLLHASPTPAEREHRIRLCCGNGLRGEVWPEFKERFGIPQILEFYAATEGNFSLYNLEGKPGAIGRIPPFLAHRFPAAIVKFDVERGEPYRDASGLCIRCARGEPGEAIGRIAEIGRALAGRFEGYTAAAETEKKVLRNVFAEGDAWVRTGDLMRLDEKGFFYFVDRIGDTFRWKGENVATAEVEEVIASIPGVAEASVYGVAVPGNDGRAGMAALVVDASFDLARLRAGLGERLPAYARPIFLRMRRELEITETFKRKKLDLVREAYDPAIVADRLYFDHRDRQAYVPLDAALFQLIERGGIRL